LYSNISVWFHDFLGSWGEGDLQLWRRYFASDEERARHAKEWPKTPLPAKEKPPFNRDWRLPTGRFGSVAGPDRAASLAFHWMLIVRR